MVKSGIKANKPALTEIFSRKSKFDALFEEYYDVGNAAELSSAKEAREAEIAKAKLARIEKIVDLDAESPEDLLTSYVGKLIIQCPQCMTLFYKDAEDVEESEDDPTAVNVNEVCQHCGNESGYMLIGKVGEATQEEVAAEAEVSSDEADDNLELEPEETDSTEETGASEKESSDDDFDLDLDGELEELDLSVDEEEEDTEKKEESLLTIAEGSTLVEELREDVDLEVSADDFEKLIKSPEFKKPISDSAVRAMIDEFKESEESDVKESLSETLTEGAGADTANMIKDALNIINGEDEEGFAKTVADVIDIIPDEFIDDLFELAKDKLNDVKVTFADQKKIIDTTDGAAEASEDADTVGKVLALFDTATWDAEAIKKCVIAILGVIAAVEPTPIVEIITGIVLILPANTVKNIVTILNPVGTLVNKGYNAAKNKNSSEDTTAESKLEEGVFDKLKDKVLGVVDKLKSREAKADWIIDNALEDYNNVKAGSDGQLVPDENNKKFDVYIVIGYKNKYTNGKEILKAPSFNSVKDLVMGMNKVQVTDEYSKADKIAKGWSLVQGNGPAFIFLAKDENDENAVFLCEYFQGELEYDQVEKYFDVVKNHIKGAKLMAAGGMDDSVAQNETQDDSVETSEEKVANLKPGMRIELDGKIVKVTGVGPLTRTADGITAYESVIEVVDNLGKSALYNMPKSDTVRVCKESIDVVMNDLDELHESALEVLISNALVEAHEDIAGFRLKECEYVNEALSIYGNVHFTSGKTETATYVFTEAFVHKNKDIEFRGLSESLNSGRQLVTLSGNIQSANKTFIAESFTYNK